MADRSAAEAFGSFFRYLAGRGDTQGGRYFYSKTRNYDFTAGQMNCDDELVVLGLARRTPEGGVEYLNEDYEDS